MKISIVSAYHNRKSLLINTLNTVKNSGFKDFEFIIVDDGSDEEHRVEDLKNEYDFLKVLRIEREDKWYVNPCIPFNVGFSFAQGEKIIIQNPECLHMGDVLNFVNENLNDNNYITFSCYSADEEMTQNFSNYELTETNISKNVTFIDRAVTSDGMLGWYNHPIYRPVGLHFTTAITKKNIRELNGFDERYAYGIGYDDNEFLRRVKQKGLSVNYLNYPIVIHQNHYNISSNYKIPNAKDLVLRNQNLYIKNK